MRRFEGRNVIVTGGSRGIGRATAERFASEGADVMLVARTLEQIEAAAATVRGGGGKAWAYTADVSEPGECQAVADAATERWGRIDVLVNNAGVDDDTPFLDVTVENWHRVLETNLSGAFFMGQRIAREMARTGGGVILHNASIDASGGDGTYVAYNASKAGMLGLNRTMAIELAPYGIRVNAVSPGFTHTEMTERAVSPPLMDYLLHRFERVPMRRLVKAEEIAAAFAFLASDDASGITGHNLTVDCGLTANWYILETLPEA